MRGRGAQDPTGYKWELIQRPDHKKDPILHVSRLRPRSTAGTLRPSGLGVPRRTRDFSGFIRFSAGLSLQLAHDLSFGVAWQPKP